MKLYDALAANTYVVRLFIVERGGLDLDVQQVDIMTMENRKRAYKTQVNARGEVPALRLDNDSVLTEVTAICEYLDEVATSGPSLFGSTALERAETRMWLSRTSLEITHQVHSWYRNDPDTVDFYRGNRIPTPEARLNQKVIISQSLNLLDDELEGKTWLCGERFSAADIHFYGQLKLMQEAAAWVFDPSRKNLSAYFKRMDERPLSQQYMMPFKESHVSI